jgi:hypothetical protein
MGTRLDFAYVGVGRSHVTLLCRHSKTQGEAHFVHPDDLEMFLLYDNIE